MHPGKLRALRGVELLHGTVRILGSADSRVKVLQIKFHHRSVVRGYNWSGERG